jgi:hypothetical protein
MMEESQIPIKETDGRHEESLWYSSEDGDSNDSHKPWISVRFQSKVMPQVLMWLLTLPDSRLERMSKNVWSSADGMVQRSESMATFIKVKLLS